MRFWRKFVSYKRFIKFLVLTTVLLELVVFFNMLYKLLLPLSERLKS